MVRISVRLRYFSLHQYFTDLMLIADAQMTIMQNLQYTEHLSEPMAELVTILAKEFDYSQLGEDVLRYGSFLSLVIVRFVTNILLRICSEIAAKKFDAQDTKGPRSFSKFLIRLAEISPRLVLKQIALLQKHLDSEVRDIILSLALCRLLSFSTSHIQ